MIKSILLSAQFRCKTSPSPCYYGIKLQFPYVIICHNIPSVTHTLLWYFLCYIMMLSMTRPWTVTWSIWSYSKYYISFRFLLASADLTSSDVTFVIFSSGKTSVWWWRHYPLVKCKRQSDMRLNVQHLFCWSSTLREQCVNVHAKTVAWHLIASVC